MAETHIVADNVESLLGDLVPKPIKGTTGNFSGAMVVDGLFSGAIENNLNAQGLAAEVLAQMTDPRLLNCLCQSPLPDMVTNGGFATDTDWTKLSDWVISGGKATYTAVTSAPRNIYQPIGSLTPGTKYIVTYTIDSIGTGTGIFVEVGGTAGTIRTSAGTYTETIICGATTVFNLSAALTTGQVVVIDNVSMTPAYVDVSGKLHDGIFMGSWTSGDREKQSRVWKYDMAGNTDKYIDVGDPDDFSFGDGSNDSPFSMFMLVEIVSGFSQMLIAKYNTTTGSELREYLFQVNSSDKIFARISDESTSVHCSIESDAVVEDGLHLIEFTYSGVGGATAMNGGTLYVDGLEVDSTATNHGSYVSMENTITHLLIGSNITSGGVFGNLLLGDYGLVGIDAAERSASDAWQLWLTVLSNYSINGLTL